MQPILDADKAAVGTRDFYDDEYFDRFFAGVKPILERRLSDSIGAVSAASLRNPSASKSRWPTDK